MKTIFIVGIALVILGGAVLGYDHYTYTTTENVLQIGPLKANVEQTHTVQLPPILGWLLIAAGAGAIVFGLWSRK